MEALRGCMRAAGAPPADGGFQSDDTRRRLENLLAGALIEADAHARLNNQRALRTLHIGASLHAALRWDKQRRFKPNDFHDFGHATAAIGYCDAFFTEAPLCELASKRQLKLADMNGCRIVASANAALEVIGALEQRFR